MKKCIFYVLIGLFLALFIGCATTFVMVLETGKGDYHLIQVYNKPFNEVWEATITVMQAFPIVTIEKESGILVTDVVRLGESKEYRIEWYPKGKIPPESQIIYTPPYGMYQPPPPSTPPGAMRCNVRVQKIDDHSTQVTVNVISTVQYEQNQLAAQVTYRPSPVQKDFQTASIGYQESIILWKIGKQLGIEQPEPVAPKFEKPVIVPTAPTTPESRPVNIYP